ncbi:MAG: helix-turn-helix transcriptional regulator [Alphaproteobacteria bacterium]|nr:helix-turn-helix transcriptional regulator [Alphaproteobacteria bacterium]
MDGRESDRFFGRCLNQAEAGGFLFGHWIAREGGENVVAHGHDHAHFMFITAGDFISEAEGGSLRAAPILVFNPADTYHQDHFVSPGGFFSVTVPNHAGAAAREMRTPQAPTHIAGATALAAAWRLMQERPNGSDEARLSAEALCLELLGAVTQSGGERRAPGWLKRACALLRDERTLPSVAAVAAELGVHPIYMARTFRVFCGCTPGEYLRAFRVHRAANLLAKSSRPVAEIATACGYFDQSHLTSSFRRLYGVSPKQFRQNLS